MIKQSVMTAWTLVRDFVRFWWTVVSGAVKLWLERNAFSYAGSLAFYTLFSLAPTVIIAVTVIGLVLGEEAAQGQIVAQLEGTMGASAAELVQNAVSQSRIQESGILPTLLGIGALLVGATTVFGQMQFSLNTLWGVTARPSSNSLWIFIKNRTLSLTVVLSIGFILLVSLALGVMVKAMLKAADGLLPFVGFLTSGAEFLVSLAWCRHCSRPSSRSCPMWCCVGATCWWAPSSRPFCSRWDVRPSPPTWPTRPRPRPMAPPVRWSWCCCGSITPR